MIKLAPDMVPLGFYVRPMLRADVDQVMEIEKEAFPTQWPPTSFHRELENRLAHYFVVCEDREAPPSSNHPPSRQGWLRRLLRRQAQEVPTNRHGFVVGAMGMWVLYDEAHITTIAVRDAYRRRGLGEILLITAIERALELQARVVTLEVRASNRGAQALYEKYGFKRTGVRRAYYTDNREDGVIMTTDPIATPVYQALFRDLKEQHAARWAISAPLGAQKSPPAYP